MQKGCAMIPVVPPISGLTHVEAIKRRRDLPRWLRLWQQVRTYALLVWGISATWLHAIIMALAVALWSVGLRADALATSSVVVINVVLGLIQAIRARYQLNQLTLISMPTVAVWRDGVLCHVAPATVVHDDIILLTAGDQVVADGVIVSADTLALDESLLTGESEPQHHDVGATIMAGAICVRGAAWYQVTSFDGIAQQIQQRGQTLRLVQTALTRQINDVMRLILVVVVVLSLMVVLRDWYAAAPLATRISNLTVIAGLIPNALVLTLTITYAIAALQMARVGGLIQQLAAVEMMHHVRVLCFDKTGTITVNQLHVAALHAIAVSETHFHAALATYVASDVSGNATTQAIAQALPGEPTVVHQHVPFDSERKWSLQEHAHGVWVLGAPDVLMPAISSCYHDRLDMTALLTQGARVVLFAHAPASDGQLRGDSPILPTTLIPYGYVVLVDAIRPHVDAVLARCQQQGIRVCVLSGDHPDAVQALVTQVGISPGHAVCHGAAVAQADDAQLAALLNHTTVFGRLTPTHKERIITMWQQMGYQVAMIGDGLNDIPAMRAADIAIAMQSGSSAVRTIADVVLLNDDFAIVPQLFQQGARIVSRMRLVLSHFLLRIVTSGAILATGVVLGMPLWAPWQSSLLALCGVALPAFWIVSMPSRITYTDLLAVPRGWRYGLGAALVGVVVVIVSTVVWPAATNWVGVGYCMLVLWGHAAWLTLRLRMR